MEWRRGDWSQLGGDAMSDYTLYLGDCLDYMRTMEPGSVDAVITDPPYGIEINRHAKIIGVATEHSRQSTELSWDDTRPDKDHFDGIKKVSKNQIVFGANYFWENFYSSSCYIIWDKRGNLPKVPFCDTEFAWTSFIDKPSKRYVVINHGFIRDGNDSRLHPTQKPLKLMLSIIEDFTNPGDLIFDPFMGSGTTGVAALQLGRRFIGCEIDPGYFAIAEKRIKQATAQMLLPLEIGA